MTIIVSAPPASSPAAIFLVTLVREDEPVLNTTTALQDVRVLGVIVAFANDVCRAELEFFWQRSGTGPLDVVLVVVGASVLATHYVDLIVTAPGAAYAFELSRV
jgi:hypothetical protein